MAVGAFPARLLVDAGVDATTVAGRDAIPVFAAMAQRGMKNRADTDLQ